MRMSEKQKGQYNHFLIDAIDPEVYDSEIKTNAGKVKFFFETFEKEHGFMIERVGLQNALSEYLQGLPSIIDLPYQNGDILDLAKRFSSIPQNATPREEARILSNYWQFMANRLIQLERKL